MGDYDERDQLSTEIILPRHRLRVQVLIHRRLSIRPSRLLYESRCLMEMLQESSGSGDDRRDAEPSMIPGPSPSLVMNIVTSTFSNNDVDVKVGKSRESGASSSRCGNLHLDYSPIRRNRTDPTICNRDFFLGPTEVQKGRNVFASKLQSGRTRRPTHQRQCAHLDLECRFNPTAMASCLLCAE